MKVKKLILWGFIIFLGCLFVSCAKKQKVLANIGSRVITVQEFQQKLDQLPSIYRVYLKTEQDKKDLLEATVKEELIIQEARERGLNKEKSITEKLKLFEDQLLLEAMIKKIRETQIKVTDSEKQDYYQKNKDKFTANERVKVSHILVKTKVQAQEILAKLKKGEDFSKLAQEYSLDTANKQKGGEIDYFTKGEMVPEFEKAAFSLNQPGELAGTVQSTFGFHILKLIDKKPAGEKSFEEAREEINRQLEKQKFDNWITGLKTKWRVKINYDNLEEINLATTETK